MKIKIFAQIFLTFPFTHIFSQKEVNLTAIKAKYRENIAVILQASENVTINWDEKKGYDITSDIFRDLLHLQNLSNNLASEKVYSSHFKRLKSIEANTLVPDKGKYKSFKVENFTTSREQSGGIFFDDLVTTHFVFPAVQPDARTILKYSMQVTDHHSIGTYYFQSFIPVSSSEFTIKADKRVKIKYELFSVESSHIQFSKEDKGKYTYYKWKAESIPEMEYEQDAPSISYYSPHLVYYIDDQPLNNNGNIETSGINNLYQWYWGFIKDLNKKEDKTIASMVDMLVKGKTDEEGKVKQIFYWVQDNIKYVAFEEGLQGLIPEEASSVFEKRYGDCKGIASVLDCMLKTAGIKSYITWIGTRDIPYKYTEIPTGITDNHMIVTYFKDNKPYFLDATFNHIKFGVPSPSIQGKQALVGINEKEYKIINVPVVPKEINLLIDTAYYTVQDKTVKGKGSLQVDGYAKIFNTYALAGKNKETAKNHILDIIAKGNNKYFVDTFSLENLENRELPLKINYNFRLEDYFNIVDGETYINMNLDKSMFNRIIDTTKRKIPIENEYNFISKHVSVFEFPSNYSVNHLPSDASSSFDKAGFSISYKLNGNKVIQTKEIFINYLLMKQNDFASWNKMIDKLDKAYREVLILQKN